MHVREARWKTDQWHTVAKAEEEEKKKKLWSVKSRAFSFYWADSHSPPVTVSVCFHKAPILFA